MLIVLGGIAAFRRPMKRAESMAQALQMFRYIMPLIRPFLFCGHDPHDRSVKDFDIISLITQGGPGLGIGDRQSLFYSARPSSIDLARIGHPVMCSC